MYAIPCISVCIYIYYFAYLFIMTGSTLAHINLLDVSHFVIVCANTRIALTQPLTVALDYPWDIYGNIYLCMYMYVCMNLFSTNIKCTSRVLMQWIFTCTYIHIYVCLKSLRRSVWYACKFAETNTCSRCCQFSKCFRLAEFFTLFGIHILLSYTQYHVCIYNIPTYNILRMQ